MKHDADQRLRLRLGALLFRLRYYAVADQCDEQGRITLYRYDAARYVEVLGATVRMVSPERAETLELADAVARCKAALTGMPLHGSAERGGTC